MTKYDLIPEQLLYEGTISSENIFSPGVLAEDELKGIHDQDYWLRLKHGSLSKSEIRKTGFPYSKQLVQRELTILQGTLDCTKYAMKRQLRNGWEITSQYEKSTIPSSGNNH